MKWELNPTCIIIIVCSESLWVIEESINESLEITRCLAYNYEDDYNFFALQCTDSWNFNDVGWPNNADDFFKW